MAQRVGADEPRVILALDVPTPRKALALAKKCNPKKLAGVKVGMQLFVAGGPALIRKLIKLGYRVFLDLKFKDIPETVALAVLAACQHGLWMLNIHADGGSAVMHAVLDKLKDVTNRPILLAVTVLTSMDASDLREVGVSCRAKKSTLRQVLRLARLTRDAGFDGNVLSGHEARRVREECGDGFILVTPGIRLPDGKKNDQKRIMTPERAILNGADYVVVGRPISGARDPAVALDEFNRRISVVLTRID